LETGELLPDPSFAERLRVMRRHFELMLEVFGETHGCRLFRKVGPWYSKQFGPANLFNKGIVLISSKAEFDDLIARYLTWRAQFLDETGELQSKFRPAPLTSSFMQDAADEPAVARRTAIPVPAGPVELW
jgi:hypothetical protein